MSESIYLKRNWNCRGDLENLKYVKIKGKAPQHSDWNVPHNDAAQYDLAQLTDDHNGVLTGYNDLLVIDFDDPMVYEEAKSILPDTLIVKTGSSEAHKKHYYYHVSNPRTKKIVDESEKTLVDVLGYTSNGKYSMAVAPGAIHPDTGAPYTIINDTRIRRLTDDEWRRIENFLEIFNAKKVIDKKKSANDGDLFEFIKENIDLEHFLIEAGYTVKDHKLNCLWHDDKEPSLHLYNSQRQLYCFSCAKSYTIIDVIMKIHGIGTNEIPEWFEKHYTSEMKRFKKTVKTESTVDYGRLFNNIYDLREVCHMDIPEPEWIVHDLIPEGLTLLAGKAKTGKSYLIFNIALGIALGDKALGHFPVNQKEVLYLALEDSLRRIKQRGNKLIAEIPHGCHVSTEWTPGKQGVEAVKRYIENNPSIGVVIVDTLAMVRDWESAGRKTLYQIDYDGLKEWRKLAQDKNVGVIIVTHSNKRENTQDPFDKVSGTTGLTGACDTVLVLEALSKKNVDFSLYVRGNDVEMADYALTFNNGLWTCEGDVEECIASEMERKVLDLFDFEDTITAKLIHEELDISKDYAKKLLKRLTEKGLVVKGDRGLYRRS